MLVDNAPYILLTVMCIVMVLRLARSLRARRRWHDHPHNYASHVVTQTPSRDCSTATCPLCGKYDATRPFISYAIDCHRKDCAS